MSEWEIDPGQWRDSSPLGKRLEERHIMMWTEWVIFLRKDVRFRCPDHWDLATSSTTTLDPTCWCLGFGMKVIPAIAPGRFSRGRNAEVKAGGEVKDDPGYLSMFSDVIHFPRIVAPQVNDIVLGCEWNKPTQLVTRPPIARPLRFHSIYMVKEINANFQREVNLFSCGLESIEIDTEHFNNMIPQKFQNLQVLNPKDAWNQQWW